MWRKNLSDVSAHSLLTPANLTELNYTTPSIVHLRDGEVVLYRRNHSPVWQCRFKRQDGKWHRQSTGQYSLERAVTTACEMYDEARFRQRLGLAHTAQTFAQIARATLAELLAELDLCSGKSVYATYITCIEKYFIPYFGEQALEQLNQKVSRTLSFGAIGR